MAIRIVGGCFRALAVYVALGAIRDLATQSVPEHSLPGVLLACVSLVVMPILSRDGLGPHQLLDLGVRVTMNAMPPGTGVGMSE